MKYYVGNGTEFKKEECKEYKTLKNAVAAAEKDENLVVWDENGQQVNPLQETEESPTTAVATGTTKDEPQTATEGENEGETNNGTPASKNGQDGANPDAGTAPEETPDAVATGTTKDEPQTATEGENEGETNNGTPASKNGQDGANPDAGTAPEETPDAGAAGATEETPSTEESENEVIIPQGTMKVTVVCDGALNLRRSAAWGNDNICGRAARGQSYYVKEIHTIDGKKMVRTIDDLYLSGASEHVQFEQL